MKLLKILLLTIFSFTFAFAALAQDSNFTDAELMEMSQALDNTSGDYYLSSQSRDVKGDPYFNSDWLKGKVQITEKAETEELLLRLNIADNILEFTRGEKVYLMNSGKIKGFTFFAQPENIVFKNGFKSEDHDIKPSTFVRIMYDGNVKMIAHYSSSLKKNIPTYGSANIKDEYVDDTEYFIIDESGSYHDVKLKKRHILRTLEKDLRDQVEEFADQQNLDFGEEQDLDNILAHYDQLKSGS
ncbi:hypothetical protein G3570_10235 [Balneolaceae bacterium YR4-1]|uniref:Uncharacterized protein n=1 Tax=Halalkalibaculum roseum TaxID=2709311 RepID=A0A6M1SVU4_9BACT|nr:hypothetical protein [Halalkalibaculum roseum]NGP77012.1 hypothetical protein [Halalkalibaculum roseum]